MKKIRAYCIACSLLFPLLGVENLHHLIRQGETINLGKESQEHVNKLDEHGHTLLFYAVLNRNDTLVATLLEKGALPDAAQQNISPLWLAAIQGNIPIIELLLKHKADPKLITTKGFSAVGAAIISGQVNILTMLAKEMSADELLQHFSSDLRARTYGDPAFIRGEGMSYESAVRDAIRAKHSSMALHLLERGVPLLTGSKHPGGYTQNTPFCLFEGIQNQCMTIPLAAALLKAGENPYARVTSTSNISRSPMMPTSAMEASLLVGSYEVAELLATKASPEPEDFLGNMELFGYSSGSEQKQLLGTKHFGKVFKPFYYFPHSPDANHYADSSIHGLAKRLVPKQKVSAEVFQRTKEKTKIAVFAMPGAEELLPITTQGLNSDEMWTCVDTEEIRAGLDSDYWAKEDVASGEIAEALDARAICVIEVIQIPNKDDAIIFHLISGHSGICVKSLRKRPTAISVESLRLDLTNAWRLWMDRCEMMQGKFHAISCEEIASEPVLTTQTIMSLRSAPHILPVTVEQAKQLKDSGFLRSSSILTPSISREKESITIQMQLTGESIAAPLKVNLPGQKMIEPNIVKDCLCQMTLAAKHFEGIANDTLDRFMQRMYATGHHEDSLFLASVLQNLDTSTNRYSTYRWSSIEKRIANFVNYIYGPSGIRNSYYPLVATVPLQRIQEYQSLMLHFAYTLNEELRSSIQHKRPANQTITPRLLGDRLRLLGYYKFFLRPSTNPEYMDQMDAMISELISSARAVYKTDEERLQLCFGIIGMDEKTIARYDLHRCVPLRDFITKEIFYLANKGIAKSEKLPLDFFLYSQIGALYRKIVEATYTAQARGSWDPILGNSFEELHQEKNGADIRLIIERDFYRANESQRPELARRIASLQCDAIRSKRVSYFTGIPLLDLSRYVPISLARPPLFDRSQWNKLIVSKSLNSKKSDGELFWQAQTYQTEAAILQEKDKKTSKNEWHSQRFFVAESRGGIYDLPNDLRDKIYFETNNSAGNMNNMIQQSELLQPISGALLGEKKNIPDITAPNSWEISKKISILENQGKSDCLIPHTIFFVKSKNTIYFACSKVSNDEKVVLFDREQIQSKAEIVSLNLQTGKISRKEHPDHKMSSQFLIQESYKPILEGLGENLLWIAPPAKIQIVNASNLALKSLNLEIKTIARIGNSHATLGDVCFVQTEETIGDNRAKFEKRSKVFGFKSDGSFITVVDTKQSPTASLLDEPQNNLQGVFSSQGQLHIFTNQSVTYQRVNPMMGICDAAGAIKEVERDEKKVTNKRNSFVANINPLSEKYPLESGAYIYKVGLPGRLVIGNGKGKFQALPVSLTGLNQEKMRISFPIYGANYSVEYSDEMPVSEFAKTLILRPEIVAETEDAFFLCSAFKHGAYLPYVWKMKKSDLAEAMKPKADAE